MMLKQKQRDEDHKRERDDKRLEVRIDDREALDRRYDRDRRRDHRVAKEEGGTDDADAEYDPAFPFEHRLDQHDERQDSAFTLVVGAHQQEMRSSRQAVSNCGRFARNYCAVTTFRQSAGRADIVIGFGGGWFGGGGFAARHGASLIHQASSSPHPVPSLGLGNHWSLQPGEFAGHLMRTWK